MRVRKGSVRVCLAVVLIVLVAGLLWAMMIPTGYPGSLPTKAPEIIGNLRSLKTAMLALYVDYIDSVDQQGRIDGQTLEDFIDSPEVRRKLKEYMEYDIEHHNISKNFTLKGANAREGEYLVASDLESGNWFIGYRLEGKTKKDERTRERLAGRAKTFGLLKYARKDSPLYETLGEDTGYVWRLVR